jgi:hypothetical protein
MSGFPPLLCLSRKSLPRVGRRRRNLHRSGAFEGQSLLLLRLRPSYRTSDFRYNDVATAVPGPTRDALGLDLEAVPAEQIPATKCCAGGRSSCRAIGALSLAGPRFMSAT